ncbi:uncharacterized protein LOC126656916 [Mercurialis annua]|uniref:uncharacterized protein LOC126656916 n=1 Tax=Mercurialis annua TaxID=3986 RepID=UPI00215DDE1F|nr:uncharacterized protein LOC126656916 [Mercurialis annua]
MISMWNIRGINNPLKQSEMVALINKFKLKIVGIVESRVNESNFNKVWLSLSNKLQNWDIYTNYVCSYIGRIWVVYSKDCLNVRVINTHKQAIHMRVHLDQRVLTISLIYGSYISSERVELLDNLKNFAENVDSSWMVVGDFNAVMNDSNRIGGNAIDVQAAEEFMDCIRCCNLIEMRRTGNNLTWCNNQIFVERIWRMLDWCFFNDKWFDVWPDAFMNVLCPGLSDHSPIVSEDSKSNSIVNRGWHRASSRCKMYRIVQQLKLLKSDFRELNKVRNNDISQKVTTMKDIVNSLQKDMMDDPFNSTLHEEERVCSKYLLKFMDWQENIVIQKSRMNWIKLGDQIRSFFTEV